MYFFVFSDLKVAIVETRKDQEITTETIYIAEARVFDDLSLLCYQKSNYQRREQSGVLLFLIGFCSFPQSVRTCVLFGLHLTFRR